MNVALVLALMLLTGTVATAQTVQIDRIDVTEYGLYTATVVAPLPGATGIIDHTVTDERLAASTRNVPMQHGVHFGFRYVVVGAPAGTSVPLRMVTIYPPPGISIPGTAAPLLRHEYMTNAPIGGLNYHDYSLDDAWELVPGVWTMEIWYGDRKLAGQSFTLAAPKR
jgi:hypothetical protein